MPRPLPWARGAETGVPNGGTASSASLRWSSRDERSNAEHRRHNGRLRTIGQLCCSDSPQRCPLSATVHGQRGTTGREAGLRYSAGRAQRGRVVSLRCYSRNVESRGWHHHERERGPAALADRPEARGFGRTASAKQARVSAISEGDSFFRRQATPAHAGKQHQQPTKHTPRRGRKAGGGGAESRGLPRRFQREVVPTGCADGNQHRRHRCRQHRRHFLGGCRHHRRHTRRHYRRQHGYELSRQEMMRRAPRSRRAAGRSACG